MAKLLHVRFDGKVLIPEEPVELPQGRRLRVVIEETQFAAADSDDAAPTLGGLADWLDSLPPIEDRGEAPTDGSKNYKHYLYGHPKVD